MGEIKNPEARSHLKKGVEKTVEMIKTSYKKVVKKWVIICIVAIMLSIFITLLLWNTGHPFWSVLASIAEVVGLFFLILFACRESLNLKRKLDELQKDLGK